jgi:hypothetical protein
MNYLDFIILAIFFLSSIKLSDNDEIISNAEVD